MHFSIYSKFGFVLLGIASALGGISYFAGELVAAKPTATDTEAASISTLDDSEKDLLTKQHLKAIMLAIHVYADKHEGMLPPATIPNANLPIEKRLSGLVAILPYLGVRPSYLDPKDADWNAWHADNARAKAIHAKIDLTKAWDDPANSDAAKTLVPEFLCPLESSSTDKQGRALTHFALVRGGLNRDNGMFPLSGKQGLAIVDISDGTTSTVALGQVHDQPGPWIAGGQSTARFLNKTSHKAQPSFGSPHPGLAYFVNGDSYVYCLNLAAMPNNAISNLSGRDDGTILDMDVLPTFSTITDALTRSAK